MLHNEKATGRVRSERFHHALAAGETITGLIFAVALVYPDKKSPASNKIGGKRMKEKLFAASVHRENILECEKLGFRLMNLQSWQLRHLRP
jgi:Predicted hydrolase (HD superfamily)